MPCGQAVNGRTTDRVTTFAPGQTIPVQIVEETNHDSYYRVSLNPNGDTFPERPNTPPEAIGASLLAEEALDLDGDADGILLGVFADTNPNSGNVVNVQVTLPDIECTNCTLQVVQVMFNAGLYHQCADLVIGDGGSPSGADAGTGGSANTSAGGGAAVGSGGGGGTSGTVGRGGGSTTGAPSGSGGAASAGTGGTSSGSGSAGTGAFVPPVSNDGDDDSGCAIAPRSSPSAAGLSALALLALGAASRRRRR